MTEKTPLTLKPIVSAIGATFAVSLVTMPATNATENPFSLTELSSGYLLASAESAAKQVEGKCGEGKCAINMSMSQSKVFSKAKDAEGVCAAMMMDMKGMVMNENKDQLPQDCAQISEEVKITVRGGRKYARKFNGQAAFAYDQQQWDAKPCSRITVTFINEDNVRHQWMIHGLPKYLYPAGMFHLEVNGPGEKTGTFIVPSAKMTYLVHCDIAQHMEKGMKAQLKVAGGDGDLPSIPGLTRPRLPEGYPEPYPAPKDELSSPYSSSNSTLLRGGVKRNENF